ncbi:major capsid protein [Sigmofec virus UA08Rod_5092]|uniref:Major capsid protein n=1 Tax=Sigmofec virus UA08Rod_5092 TaxID=2929415 RepID=A0A976R5B6_9VIRU|nr:major capsid protein [Sigmofec virus UA08Rod_5092]
MSNSNFYRVTDVSQNAHFTKAMFSEAERSSMSCNPLHLTTLNAGDIVPIYCHEILPEQELSIDVDFVLRQTTIKTPTMGSMRADIIAFWVPNRIVNQSWKAVEGENYSGSWTAPSVSLVPLYNSSSGSVQVPIGSVADYYGFPTQQPIPASVLNLCHDLKFRGYVMIYNEFFRDQNYQPPIPLSTLNVFQGFFGSAVGSAVTPLDPVTTNVALSSNTKPDGSPGAGAVAHALYGSGSGVSTFAIPPRNASASSGSFRALMSPLKANKLHDYFTSVLPSPQKSNQAVFAPVSGYVKGTVPVTTSTSNNSSVVSGSPLRWQAIDGTGFPTGMTRYLYASGSSTPGGATIASNDDVAGTAGLLVMPSNLVLQSGSRLEGLELDVADIRMASAIQQVYEILARGGSRYKSIVASFFGVEVDDPFGDTPVRLGSISRELDLYQTAQTSESSSGGTPQGNLAAFGYTNSGGYLFSHRFLEHGYLHIFMVVRHRNVYSSYLSRDNFRLNMLDFYLPPLANISEQPVYTREINPFSTQPNGVFGYQEAWAEYRFEPDTVSGLMRTGVEGSLAIWNYADDFSSNLRIADGNWLKSNSQEVLDRSLAVSSSVAPQFKLAVRFNIKKDLPMPTFGVPGMDII